MTKPNSGHDTNNATHYITNAAAFIYSWEWELWKSGKITKKTTETELWILLGNFGCEKFGS